MSAPRKSTKRKAVYRLAMKCAAAELAEVTKRHDEIASRKAQLSIAISILGKLARLTPRGEPK